MHGYVHHLIDPLQGQHLCQLQDTFLFFPHVYRHSFVVFDGLVSLAYKQQCPI